MSDVRRLMGRLYPPGMKYTAGFAGRPTIAPEDITGALGFVRDRFAREVFCALWWPEGASLTGKQFDLELRDRQMREWIARQRALVVARLAVDVAHDEVTGAHAGMRGVRRALTSARAELEEARNKAWPPWHKLVAEQRSPEKRSRYAAIRQAVMLEIASPRSCKVCAGRGHVRADALVVKCEACAGTGQRGHSERRRAESIGMTHQAFERWACVYEWTYRLCKDADEKAAAALKANLENDGTVKMAAC
jgi:hypothetical protein